MSQREAYKNAYSVKNMSDNAIDREACLLMKNPKVSQRYRELGAETEKETIMTAQDRLEYLTRVIKGDEEEEFAYYVDGKKREGTKPIDINTRLRAIDLMNKMQGEYVTKVVGNLEAKLEDLL